MAPEMHFISQKWEQIKLRAPNVTGAAVNYVDACTNVKNVTNVTNVINVTNVTNVTPSML